MCARESCDALDNEMGESGFCEEAFDIVDNSQEVFLDSTSGRIVV